MADANVSELPTIKHNAESLSILIVIVLLLIDIIELLKMKKMKIVHFLMLAGLTFTIVVSEYYICVKMLPNLHSSLQLIIYS